MRLGDWVRVTSTRPHKEKYNDQIGQVVTITNRDIVYVAIGRYTPNFYLHELETLAPSVGGAA